MNLRTVGLALFFLSLWQSRELLVAWQSAPLERVSGLLFTLWALPSLWELRTTRLPQPSLVTAGLALTALGTLTDIHALCFGGLALSLAAWRRSFSLIYVLAALLWMPLTSMIGMRLHLPALLLLGLRSVLLVLCLLPWNRTRHEKQ
ncbi:hypothetical protein [Armatimonas rosea]|uniref:Uncharacterized protein n=1 Tax=Armatimonas rosea TaxID=685828 RepID=A0A7W9SLA3_ARMRO|nr:hypothetical protein [Armatimonas rosea]MBB6048732.1 hypothetical protein [Armatimonas rosea]